MSKKLLSESQIRRFQKLAVIPATNTVNEISHLCATLVTEKKSGKVGHPINHTLLEDGTVTHYDVEFDDVIVEGMPVSVLEVELQQEHMHTAKRDDYKHGDKPRKQFMEEEEELDEAHCSKRDDETMEEGGAAARTGNENHDVGKNRMTPDRIREEEEKNDMEEAAHKDKEKVEESKSLSESQTKELVSRIKTRILAESTKADKLSAREQNVRLVEARMIQNIEARRAAQQKENLTEALVERVVQRLKESKES